VSDLDAALKAAQAATKKKDASSTVKALEDALVLARRDAPLDVRAAVPIHHDHVGLGLYTPAPGDVVEGRRVRLYVEVANFAMSPLADGVARVQLEVTGEFSYDDTSEGKLEVVKLPTVPLGTQSFETRNTSAVTSFGVELKLGDKSPAGTYHVKLVVKDAVSGKTGSRDARFVIV
jgi:hypothetical protein